MKLRHKKGKLKFGELSRHSEQLLSLSDLLFKNVKTEKYKILIVPLFMSMKLSF
jgi:hypothetical protein